MQAILISELLENEEEKDEAEENKEGGEKKVWYRIICSMPKLSIPHLNFIYLFYIELL